MTRRRYLDPIIAWEILLLEMGGHVGAMTRGRYLDSIVASRALLYEQRSKAMIRGGARNNLINGSGHIYNIIGIFG